MAITMATSSPSKERPVLIFLHLHKTGGSSLRKLLRNIILEPSIWLVGKRLRE